MPTPKVSLQDGSVLNPPAALEFGQPFQWANPAVGTRVDVTGCSGFCTANSFQVPGAPQQGEYGLADATMLSNPTSYSFSQNPNQWNAPGMPRISNPPVRDENAA